MSATMQAIIATGTGGPDVLQLVERPVPVPRTGEVLIRTAAAGVNRPDLMQRTGALPVPPDAPDVFGLEIAGKVVAVGAGVEAALDGATVMALVKGGGYATHTLAMAAQCLPVPDDLSLQEAAALPEGLFTIWHNLFDRGALQPGARVLIEGGAGGIGTLAVQLARAWGADVIATAGGADKCARIEKLGATAIDYRTADLVDEVMRLTGVEWLSRAALDFWRPPGLLGPHSARRHRHEPGKTGRRGRRARKSRSGRCDRGRQVRVDVPQSGSDHHGAGGYSHRRP